MSRTPTLKQRLDALAREMLDKGIRLEEAKGALEHRYLVHAMRDCAGNQTRAAVELQMHRNTLRRKLLALAVDPREC